MSIHSAPRSAGTATSSLLLAFMTVFSVFIVSEAVAQEQEVPIPALEVQDRFPGVQVFHVDTMTMFYGKPMTSAETPEIAVDTWLQENRDGFGVEDLRLVERWSNPVGVDGRFTVFAYTQELGGLPVEHSQGRILTLDSDTESTVVFASGDLVERPEGGFAFDYVSAEEALLSVQAMREYTNLTVWKPMEKVVLPPRHDNTVGEPLRTWKFIGHNEDQANFSAFTFFVDCFSGDLVHVRSEIYHVDVDGNISGNATPGTAPDTASNPPVAMPLVGARARINNTDAYADTDGDYTVPNGGTGQVTVLADFEGEWVNVLNDQGAEMQLSENVTPPGPADFFFNSSPTEFDTAQVNAIIHGTGVHDWYKERQPGYNGIDFQIPCNVNLNQNCNAFFSPAQDSINFFTAGGGCANTAFTSVIYHEYGHYIVDQMLLAQGAFGEGFSDCVGVLAFDNPIVGEDFFGPGTEVRNVETADIQYPCSGQIHFCGQLLGGCWWDMNQEFQSSMGSVDGLAFAQQLFTDWSQITIGGIGTDSAHPGTAIEVLTVNDDNGDLGDGTPNYSEICNGFSLHSIDCPPLPNIAFEFPNGLPTVLSPGAAFTIPVNVIGIVGTPEPGTGMVHVSIDGGGFNATPMNVIGTNQYEAVLPGVACASVVNFYFSADDTGGGTTTSPSNAPTASNSAISSFGGTVQTFIDDMETNAAGWTAGIGGDDATTGVWERGDPIGTAAQPEDDHSVLGSDCWFTGQGSPGGTLGENDVDGGTTTLLSPIFDLSAGGGYQVSYWRWYSNNAGASPNNDTFLVEISNTGGAPWTTVEIVGPDTPDSNGGWFQHEFLLTDFVTPTSTVRMRFRASDLGAGSIVEAALDDFEISEVQCEPGFQRGDCNQDSERNISDPIFFLDGVFGGGGTNFLCDDACDANDDGAFGIDDAIDLLGAIFLGDVLPDPFTACGDDLTGDGFDCDTPQGCM